MSATIQISRDTEGIRVELKDSGDARVLEELGPYTLIMDGTKLACLPDSEGVSHVLSFDLKIADRLGLRFADFNAGLGEGVKTGRFGPIQIEANIYDPEGFSVELPPLHERPWPQLRENELRYDVSEQMVLTLAERINDRIDFCGMPVKDVIRLESRLIPPDLRRFLPRRAESLVLDQMAKLRLPLEVN